MENILIAALDDLEALHKVEQQLNQIKKRINYCEKGDPQIVAALLYLSVERNIGWDSVYAERPEDYDEAVATERIPSSCGERYLPSLLNCRLRDLDEIYTNHCIRSIEGVREKYPESIAQLIFTDKKEQYPEFKDVESSIGIIEILSSDSLEN